MMLLNYQLLTTITTTTTTTTTAAAYQPLSKGVKELLVTLQDVLSVLVGIADKTLHLIIYLL